MINKAWIECIDQKFILLGCLENLDIICKETEVNTSELMFFFFQVN